MLRSHGCKGARAWFYIDLWKKIAGYAFCTLSRIAWIRVSVFPPQNMRPVTGSALDNIAAVQTLRILATSALHSSFRAHKHAVCLTRGRIGNADW